MMIICLAAYVNACAMSPGQSRGSLVDISQYTDAYVASIDISSKEKNGNAKIMNGKVRRYVEKQLDQLFKFKNYRRVTSDDPFDKKETLAFSLDVDIVYGSRVNRYWSGTGAGKGIVKSTITVADDESGEILRSVSESSTLSVGTTVGITEAVIRQNIDILLSEYLFSTP